MKIPVPKKFLLSMQVANDLSPHLVSALLGTRAEFIQKIIAGEGSDLDHIFMWIAYVILKIKKWFLKLFPFVVMYAIVKLVSLGVI